jgi:hypothetical protein
MQRQFDFDTRPQGAQPAECFETPRVKAIGPMAVQDQKQTIECRSATKAQEARPETRQETGRKLRDRIEQIGWRCELSGARLTPDTFSLDHIIPLAHGGSHDASNIQFVHPIINAMKGTLSMKEFVGWCKLVAEHIGGESE